MSDENKPGSQESATPDAAPVVKKAAAKKERKGGGFKRLLDSVLGVTPAEEPAAAPVESGASEATDASADGGKPAAEQKDGEGGATTSPPAKSFYQPDPDVPLEPHSFHPQVEMLRERLPRVMITPDAYKRMCLYVEIASKEVGWLGTISRLPNGDFLIEETYLLEQEVHETETELASESIGELAMALINSGEDGLEKANKLRFWGHSHVRMGTGPSGTDERTMDRFGREGNPWFVRGIFNKRGRGEFTIYLFERGMRINDAAWSVWDPETKSTVFVGRRRFTGFTKWLEGGTEVVGVAPPVTQPKHPLAPSDELRQEIEAEFKLKVKERLRLWGGWKGLWGSDQDKEDKDGKPGGKGTDKASEAPAEQSNGQTSDKAGVKPGEQAPAAAAEDPAEAGPAPTQAENTSPPALSTFN